MTDLTLYNSIKEKMQTGDCLLWQSRSIIGWLIRKFSHANVNHAGLIIKPHKMGYFLHRRFTIEALENGIQLRLLSERLRSFKGRVWLYPLKDEYNDLRDEIAIWAMSKEGTPYDYKSLFKQVAGRVKANVKELFCSEAVYFGYRHVNIVDEQKAPRPGDIPSWDIFKEPLLTFEG